MQDRYAGDVGDFVKFGLLRMLCGANAGGLSLGVNWYLAPEESHNADGKHVAYLHREQKHHAALKACDAELLERLAVMVGSGKRSVAALEEVGVLPAGTLTFSQRLGAMRRHDWHQAALRALERARLVFLDPDNGVRSTARDSKDAKFVFPQEIAAYTARRQSVVVYHHADRSPGGTQAQLPRLLGQLEEATGLPPLGSVIAHRGSRRFFQIIPAPAHVELLRAATSAFIARWSKHVSFFSFGAPG